jgi:hypothetical protein
MYSFVYLSKVAGPLLSSAKRYSKNIHLFVKGIGELSAYHVYLSSDTNPDPGSGAFLTLGPDPN